MPYPVRSGFLAGLVCALSAASTSGQGASWNESTPAEQGVAPSAIQSMIQHVQNDPRFSHAYALVVARHGTLIGEAYFGGASRDDLFELRSVSKSVTALATGVAIQRGEISGVDALVRDLLPSYSDLLAGRPQWDMTLDHLLTMQPGLQWSDSTQLNAIYQAPDLVDYVLRQPSLEAPGTRFRYSTGLSQVLARALTRATGMSLHAYADRHLFGPLGISRSEWKRRPNGDHFGGIGVTLRPRDQCKIGQMALQEGFWRGDQVVPRGWIRASRQDYDPAANNGYGYRWWVPGPGRFVAIGYGGQYIDVDRDTDSVICLTVEWEVPSNTHIELWEFDALRTRLAAGFLPETPGSLTWVDEQGTAIDGPVLVPEQASNSSVTVAVRRDGALDGSLVARLEAVGGSARAGRDFSRLLRELRWEAGEGGEQTIEVQILADQRSEGDEDFFLRLETVAGIDDPPADLELVITEAPATPETTLSWSEELVSIEEGTSAPLFLQRQGPLDEGLEVPLVWTAGSATADDFSSLPTALVFAAGESLVEATLEAIADGELEPTELGEFEAGPIEFVIGPGPLQVTVRDESRVGATGCEVTAPGCLHDGRFLVEAEWLDPAVGARRSGSVSAIASGTGPQTSLAVQFFAPSNVEMMVKVVDGRSLNGHFWTYFGKASDLAAWLVITDYETGRVRVLQTPAGTTCGGGDVEAFPDQLPDRPAGRGVVAAPLVPGISARGSTAGECPSDALCFHDRFEARAQWSTARGSGNGTPLVAADGTDSGFFWFFGPENVEVSVKVLDARGTNGRFWVFGGSLTDQAYTLTILDRETGIERSYEHAAGDLCGIADTAAFE